MQTIAYTFRGSWSGKMKFVSSHSVGVVTRVFNKFRTLIGRSLLKNTPGYLTQHEVVTPLVESGLAKLVSQGGTWSMCTVAS